MAEPSGNKAKGEVATDDRTQELSDKRSALVRRVRHLQDSPFEPAHVELGRIADWCRANDIRGDVYGRGRDIEAFESRVANMLSMPAARFMPSGTMAQQIAVRLWCDRSGRSVAGMHPSCHITLHEHDALTELHGVEMRMLGEWDRPLAVDDLPEDPASLGALVVELPTRENGGRLPAFDDLVALVDAARASQVPVHLDGARLWEAAAGYGRPPAELCALFDSVYVSFYKGVGALAGAMLLGPVELIEDAVVWQRRHGGNLYNATANWVSAAMRLDDRIGRMPQFIDRAQRLAASIATLPGVIVEPDPPQVNMFHVRFAFPGDLDELLAERDRIAEAYDLWLFGGAHPGDDNETYRIELTIGDAALDIGDDVVIAAFRSLLAHSHT